MKDDEIIFTHYEESLSLNDLPEMFEGRKFTIEGMQEGDFAQFREKDDTFYIHTKDDHIEFKELNEALIEIWRVFHDNRMRFLPKE